MSSSGGGSRISLRMLLYLALPAATRLCTQYFLQSVPQRVCLPCQPFMVGIMKLSS